MNFDVKAYQAKIDKICGLTPKGKSTVILSWMPDIENYTRYYSEWDTAGFGTETVLRCQYVERTVVKNGRQIDIPPNRWALKQWQDGSQYAAIDDKLRWLQKQVGQQRLLRENRPALPTEGRYIPLISIGKHNSFCCKEAKGQGFRCWGEYREPDESYLTLLKKAVAQREKENGQNPNEPISQRTLMEAAKEAAIEIKRKEKEADDLLDDMIKDNFKEMTEYYTGVKLDPKIFGFPSKVTKSGLVVPK